MILALLSRFWPYILAGLLLTYAAFYVRGAERAKDRVAEAERRMLVSEQAASINQMEFESCLALNRDNAAQAEAQRQRAEAAVKRVRELESQSDEQVREVDNEAETLRAVGLDCPAIDSAFRGWMFNRTP